MFYDFKKFCYLSMHRTRSNLRFAVQACFPRAIMLLSRNATFYERCTARSLNTKPIRQPLVCPELGSDNL